jgi:hypothetical protein
MGRNKEALARKTLASWKLPSSSNLLGLAFFYLPIADCPMPIAHSSLPNADCPVPTQGFNERHSNTSHSVHFPKSSIIRSV